MKNNTNQNREAAKQTPRFKVLDAVIILLIITAVLGIYFRFNLLDKLNTNKDIQDYTVSFSIQDIRYTTEKYFNVGDVVYDAATGNPIGVLTTASDGMSDVVLSVAPANKYFTMDDGTIEEIPYPNSESRIDATGRMICSGNYSADAGFLIDGLTPMSPGQSIQVRTETVSFTLNIVDIEPVAEK